MKRTKVFYNALILLATLLLTACQDQKDIPEVSSPEKNLVLSEHMMATSITNTTAWTIHWDCPTTILPTFIVTPTTDSG